MALFYLILAVVVTVIGWVTFFTDSPNHAMGWFAFGLASLAMFEIKKRK